MSLFAMTLIDNCKSIILIAMAVNTSDNLGFTNPCLLIRQTVRPNLLKSAATVETNRQENRLKNRLVS